MKRQITPNQMRIILTNTDIYELICCEGTEGMHQTLIFDFAKMFIGAAPFVILSNAREKITLSNFIGLSAEERGDSTLLLFTCFSMMQKKMIPVSYKLLCKKS